MHLHQALFSQPLTSAVVTKWATLSGFDQDFRFGLTSSARCIRTDKDKAPHAGFLSRTRKAKRPLSIDPIPIGGPPDVNHRRGVYHRIDAAERITLQSIGLSQIHRMAGIEGRIRRNHGRRPSQETRMYQCPNLADPI
jgi:hypothetical protein